MEQEFDIGAYVGMLRRRIWFLIIPAVLVSIAGFVLAYSLPPVYEAQATILVESQQIPTALAAPTVTAAASERIQVIQQRLLARNNLLGIANEFNLYDYEGNRRTPTTIVENMRDAITIGQIDVGGSRGTNVIGFTVGFKYRNASISSRVTNELVESILSQNLESRLARASETSKFFEDQLSELEQRILNVETRIANYKRENGEALPETLGDRRVELAQVNAQINAIDLRLQATEANADGSVTNPLDFGSQQLSFALRAKQIELDALKEERDEIAGLAERGLVAKNRLRELERELELQELNVEAIEAQMNAQLGLSGGGDIIERVTNQRNELAARAEELRESIAKTPVVEIELAGMNREYDNLRAEYQQSQARLEDALTGERLEEDRQSERFEVIEQATVPSQPSDPNRPRIVMAGAFGGIAAGAGLVILLELLNKSIYTANDLERRLQLRPIATIPYVTTSSELRRRRLRILTLTAIAAGIFAILVVAVHIYYLPIDYVIGRIIRSANSLFSSVLGRV